MRSRMLLLLLGVLAWMPLRSSSMQPPNIVFLLTDDQDLLLGGASAAPLPTHYPRLKSRGATFTNWFVHTPVCCPSRSEILTGKYFHSLARTPANRWDAVPSTGMAYQCMHINETMLSPGPTFAAHLARTGTTESTGSTGSTEGALRRRRHLQQPGAAAADHAPYAVGFFGKYLNISPRQAPTGAHTYFVNPGPEAGSAKDPTGEYYPSFWYQVVPSKGINTTWNNTEMQYETSLIAASATAWIAEVVAEDATRPFFLYAAPHAPHGAAIPAPEHAAAFGPTGLRAPITPSWNVSARDHHWLVAQQPPVRESEVLRGDQKFTQRWQCLLSVDELIGQLVDAVDAARATNNTYFIVTSDHGFHFHELRLGVGKWNVYDVDIRVPMVMAGPGITPGSTIAAVGSHVDLAPTWLAMAGVQSPHPEMDGRSLLGSILHPSNKTRQQDPLASTGVGVPEASARPEGVAYIEYHGLGPVGAATGRWMDSLNNTYRALRIVRDEPPLAGNWLYAEFGGSFNFSTIVFRELYDVDIDPWQITNVYTAFAKEDPAMVAQLAKLTRDMYSCRGAACR